MVCQKGTCGNWIWTDKVRSGTKCRKCGTWWPEPSRHNGKGKGYGRPNNRPTGTQTWLDSPPGLTKIKPLKKSKVQQEATDLLASSWTALPEDTQTKLPALGIGPAKPKEPALQDLLNTHMDALPQQVQEIVAKLTAPKPITEREIAGKLKGQEHVHQEAEPVAGTHRWSQGPICQPPDRDARALNKAGGRPKGPPEALRGLHEGRRQPKPAYHGAQ